MSVVFHQIAIYKLYLHLSKFSSNYFFSNMREVVCGRSLPPRHPALPISLLSYCSINIPCFSSGLPCLFPTPFYCCLLYPLISKDPIWKHPMDKFGPGGITAPSHHLICLCFFLQLLNDDVPLIITEINYLMSYVFLHILCRLLFHTVA